MDVILQGAINLVFSIALFINALLFIPQAIKILKEKSALGLSLWTFTGFLLTQIAAILYGIIHKDIVLTVGYLLSLITCGWVVLLALMYKTSKSAISFEDILKQLPGQVYWKDKTGKYVWRNDESLKYFGFHHNAQSTMKTDYDLFTREVADYIKEIDTEVLKGATKINEESLALQINNKESYLTYKTPLKDKNDKIIGLLGISLDVTEFKKIFIQKLHTLEHIIAMMPGNVYWVNKDNIYQGCNDNQAKLSGLVSRKDIIGKRNSDLPWNLKAGSLPDDLDTINTNVMESGIVTVVEEPATLADGTQLTYLSTKAAIYDDKSNVIGMVGISVDITERKKMEMALRHAMLAAEAASRAKSDFIENISHDLRTPLTGVVIMSDDLKDKLQGLGGAQEALWLNKSAQQLLEFCNNILDAVAADNYSEQDLKEECFDLQQLIQDVGNLEMPMIKTKGLNFIVNFDKNAPLYVVTDKAKLYRILLNLLGNAVKFTPKGHVSIEVGLVSKDEDSATLNFCVIDTGIGIKTELQEQVFDRFFRVDPSYKGVYSGNGLGLYIAQKYVQLLGAERIYVDSKEHKGCTFYFTISFRLCNEKEMAKIKVEDNKKLIATTTDISQHENYKAPLLLLIEDNKPALRGLETMVKKAGAIFQSAEDAETGVALAKSQDFDLIISDIGLPGISGIEATKVIRSWEKENNKKRVPIIALTGHAAQMAEAECINAGMDKVLTKPANLDSIKSIIKQFVAKNIHQCNKMTEKLRDEEFLESKTNLRNDLPDTDEELFMLEQYSCFDIQIVEEIYGYNREVLVDKVVKKMSSQIPIYKAELITAFKIRDWDEIAKLTGKIKDEASSNGVLRVKYACQYLYAYIKGGHVKYLEDLYHQLIKILDETKNYLKGIIQ